MARIVNEAVYAARRNAILDAAQRAIEARGYEQMAIADLLGELEISSGAFYHYFDSKPALLTALIERIGEQVEQRVLSIINDPALGALDKLRRLFVMFDQEKFARLPLVLAYMRIWYADENALVRQKLYKNRILRLTPWLEQIIHQGIRENVLKTPYPDHAGRIVISLLEDLSFAAAELILAEEHTTDDLSRLERLVAATVDALERVLVVPTGTLQQSSREELARWLGVPSPLKGE